MRWLVRKTDKIRLTKIDSENSVQMSWVYHKNYDYMNNMKVLTRKNIYKTVKVIIIDNYKIEPRLYGIDSSIISINKTSGVMQVKQFFSIIIFKWCKFLCVRQTSHGKSKFIR
jgi:hypothetical protein